MSIKQTHRPVTPVSVTQIQGRTGLVAQSRGAGAVAFSASSFSQFVANHVVAHLPQDERTAALAYLGAISGELAGAWRTP